MARPRKPQPDARLARVNLRFTAAERAVLAARAAAAGTSVSAYARCALLASTGQGVPAAPASARHALEPAAIAALNRAGANLNQLARRANAGDLLQPGELPETLADLKRSLARIEALVLREIER